MLSCGGLLQFFMALRVVLEVQSSERVQFFRCLLVSTHGVTCILLWNQCALLEVSYSVWLLL